MASAFASPQTHAGGFRADKLKLIIGTTVVAGLVIQNVQFSFQQQVTLLYEIGSNNVYYVGGRAQGSATVARILGPGKLQCELLTFFGDLCNPRDVSFGAASGCALGTGCNYLLKKAVMTTIAVSVSANDLMINEQLQMMFTDIDMTAGAA